MAGKLTIDLGTSLLLDLTYQRGEEKRMAKNIQASLIGLDHGTHLAIKLTNEPLEKYHYFFAHMGEIVVKYILRGKAYAFHCTLLFKTESPIQILYLSYPEAVESMGLRKEERGRCNPLAVLKRGATSYRGLLYDINRSGCRVDLIDPYPEHSRILQKQAQVELSFHLPGSAESCAAEGHIIWSRRIEEAWCVGVGFSSMSETTRAAIEEFLGSLSGRLPGT